MDNKKDNIPAPEKKRRPRRKARHIPFISIVLLVMVFGIFILLMIALGVQASSGFTGVEWNLLLSVPNNIVFYAGLCMILLYAVTAVLMVTVNNYLKSEKQRIDDEEAVYGERFSKLLDIDYDAKEYTQPFNLAPPTLGQICVKFRDFACSRMGLYYDLPTIRSFIAGLSVSRLLILQGMSGTGKTSLAFAFGKFIGNPSVVIPVQPSWKDRTDLLGYYNEFTNVFNETELLSKLYEAEFNDNIYICVLDEMNIARVEYYFAEFLSVLELPDSASRTVEITSDSRSNDPEKLINGRLHISDNVWFVGTANNDDSTLAISDKVYDRANVIDLDRRATPFTAPDTKGINISGSYLRVLFDEARGKYALGDEMREKIAKLDAYLIEHLGITFGNRIMRQLEGYVPVYIACGGNLNEAVDQIIGRKVLRKLEGQNPVYVRNEAEGLLNEIEEIFGAGGLPVCTAYLSKFIQ